MSSVCTFGLVNLTTRILWISVLSELLAVRNGNGADESFFQQKQRPLPLFYLEDFSKETARLN